MTNLSWRSPKLTTRTVTLAAMLIALQTVLSKISFGSDNLVKFGLGFMGTTFDRILSRALAWRCCFSHWRLDQEYFILDGKHVFIGFTFSAFITGLIAGAFLYQQKLLGNVSLFTNSFRSSCLISSSILYGSI